jgi:predicted anti-sigma-YlaC factor YlaD
MPTEPTLEELSGYLDHELDAAAQARVADHVTGCDECRTRLDGLRQTAYAIRALPMETPARTFTIPAQRRQSFRWAPVGWLGSGAAAALIVVFGVSHLNFQSAGSPTASTSTVSGGLAAAPNNQYAAPLGQGQVAPLDASVQGARAASHSAAVKGAQQGSRLLTIGTDARSYVASGVITLHVATQGLSVAEASTVRLYLLRDSAGGGYGVRLGPPTKASTYPLNYDAGYSIAQMQLPGPVAGNYTLQVAIDTGDGYALIAQLPLTITP